MITTTDQHAMPSPRPIAPSPSARFGFTETELNRQRLNLQRFLANAVVENRDFPRNWRQLLHSLSFLSARFDVKSIAVAQFFGQLRGVSW